PSSACREPSDGWAVVVSREPIVITCAITGGMTVPAQSSHIPITVDDIVEEGVRASEAGASILHLHVRDEITGEPSADRDLFRRALDELRDRTDAIIQPTTGGGRGMSIDERGRVLELRPEMATLNVGSFNFGLFPVLKKQLEL